MSYVLIAYLLAKSLLRLCFTEADIFLADRLEDVEGCPNGIHIIANLKPGMATPEAWSDFVFDVKSALGC